MCGHVGIAGKLEFKDEATMKRLLIYDFFRGPDSTGFASVNKAGTEGKLAKIASHPLDLFDTNRFKAALSGYNSAVFMGHNRAATRGVVNGVNAHPFEFGHIVGCHNGTLEMASFRALEEALGEKFDVDSQAIFAAIAKLGIEATVPLLQGAWALVWFDFNERTLNFLRNKERPFWYAYSKEFDRMFWASEWPMIDAAVKLSAQGYELYSEEKTGFRFWSTPENMHLKFDIEILQKGGADKPKPVAKELKGKEPTPVVKTATTGTDPFARQTGSGSSSTRTTTSTTTSRGTSRTSTGDETLVHLFGNNVAPFAGFITKERFDAMAKYGCSWCGTDVEFDEVGVTVYEKNDTVLCPSCSCGDQNHNRVYTTDIDKVKAL